MGSYFGIPIENLNKILSYAWNLSLPLNYEDKYCLDHSDNWPLVWVSSIFEQECSKLLRAGLKREYQTIEEVSAALRGTICWNKTLSSGLLRVRKLAMEQSLLNVDCPENQLIVTALAAVVENKLVFQKKDLHAKLTSLLSRLMPIQRLEPREAVCIKPSRTRHNIHYDVALKAAQLILRVTGSSEDDGHEAITAALASKHVLNRVFENFIRNFVTINFSDFSVVRKSREIRWRKQKDDRYHPFLPRLYADLVFDISANDGVSETVVVDMKCYTATLVGNLGSEKIRSSHLQQLYTYVANVRPMKNCTKRGILIYPLVSETAVEMQQKLEGMTLEAYTIDLTAPWGDVEQSLKQILLGRCHALYSEKSNRAVGF